jgi:hypothetical protein
MATESYWFVREQVGSGLYHLVDANTASPEWQVQPQAQALCGQWIAREGDAYETQGEGDMLGEPTCHACFRRAVGSR